MSTAPWTFSSETDELTDVLLCAPSHYEWIPTNDIARRSIESGKRSNRSDALAQFRELESVFDDAGVRRHYLEPQEGLPYQVYTRDSSQVTPWGMVLTQLERPQRRGEIGPVLRFYASTQAPTWRYATAGTIEGGDIHVIAPGFLAIGVSGGRTSMAGARQFAGWFEDEGWEVAIVPFAEHFLHLDVIFCMVAERLALACVDVLDDGFLAWLTDHRIRLLPVSYKEAMNDMGCNVLSLGSDRIVSPRHCVRVNEMMKAEGLRLLTPELNIFSTGGGSVHCMTMPLKRVT